jgi:protocatechuate 3,4-dioxygenase beta subunit
MDNDDLPIGRILNRREVLALLGAGGAALLAACGAGPASPATTTTAQSTAAATKPAATPAATAGGAGPSPAAQPTGTAAAAGATGTPALNAEAATAVAIGANPTARATQATAVGTAAAASTAVPNCVVRPQVTEGPYYVDVDQVRADIREGKEGATLALTFNVVQVAGSGCTPLQGAEVEIWHCDAAGAYSGVADPGFSTTGQTWLRGTQVTSADGVATFTTIYPGWYQGRAVHIHFKVRPTPTTDFTSQLFFDEALTDQVHAQAPYASKGKRDTLNSTDGIYNQLLLLTTTQTAHGYAATFPIGVDLSTIGTPQPGGGAAKPGAKPAGTPPSGTPRP